MENIDKFREVLSGIADNIRAARGTTEKIPFSKLAEMSRGLEVPPSIYVLVDEDGNEMAAVLSEERVELTARAASDIRAGTTAITGEGFVEGSKEIPSYYTAEGFRVITDGSLYAVPHDHYDYKKFQAIICAYNTTSTDSVAAEKVAVNDNVYGVGSTQSLSSITKDSANRRVSLGIANDSGAIRIIRYFMYKEM